MFNCETFTRPDLDNFSFLNLINIDRQIQRFTFDRLADACAYIKISLQNKSHIKAETQGNKKME